MDQAAVMGEEVHRRRWVILGVLNLSVFVTSVDSTIVTVALPTLSNRLQASTSDLQWVLEAYMVPFVGLLLACGSLGDRYGRKGALQLGLVLFAGFSLVATWADSAGQLIAARTAMGLGAAIIYPATLASLTNVFSDPRERARAIGAWAATAGLAAALGPVAGGWLLGHFWWGSVFLVNVPICAVALLAGARLLPRSKDPAGGRLDPLGLLTSVAAIGLLVYTLIEAPDRGWTEERTLGGFAISAALLTTFILHERRRSDPMLDVRIFDNPRFSAGAGVVALAFFALNGLVFLITQYLQFIRGYSAFETGTSMLPFAVGMGIAAPVGARLALRFGTKAVVTAGFLVMAAGYGLAATLAADSAYWGPVIVVFILVAIGLGLSLAPATDAVMGSLRKARAGVGAAVNNTTCELGGALGPAVMGSVFSSAYAPRITESFVRLSLPGDGIAAARRSVAGALGIAAEASLGVRDPLASAIHDAFMDGMRAGARFAAGAALLGAAIAVAWLPSVATGSSTGSSEELTPTKGASP